MAARTKSAARLQVAIERSTAKAHLITAAGRKGWVQRRWLAADNTVAAKTFEKAAANYEAREGRYQAEREHRNSLHQVSIVRETEKAIAAEAEIEFAGSVDRWLIWFPKSQIVCDDNVAAVPGWLLEAKRDQALEEFQPRDSYSRHRWCKGERPTSVTIL